MLGARLDRLRTDDYYLGEGSRIAARLTATGGDPVAFASWASVTIPKPGMDGTLALVGPGIDVDRCVSRLHPLHHRGVAAAPAPSGNAPPATV